MLLGSFSNFIWWNFGFEEREIEIEIEIEMRLGFLFLSSSSPVVGSSISRSIVRPAPSLLLHHPFHFIPNRTTTNSNPFQFSPRSTLTASASSMASTFKPEQARVPPALQLPSPPITKVSLSLCLHIPFIWFRIYRWSWVVDQCRNSQKLWYLLWNSN